MNVFFYGLFMDDALLARKGVTASSTAIGYAEGFGLRIGARATLVRMVGARAYGVVMTISNIDARGLYAESSVADYVPEPVIVTLVDGGQLEATCYNLPIDKVTGTNRDYAKALLEVAEGLEFPAPYLSEIKQFT